MPAPAIEMEELPRVSSSDLNRQPGQVVEDVLRHTVVILQKNRRDTIALVDIEEYKRLLEICGQAATS